MDAQTRLTLITHFNDLTISTVVTDVACFNESTGTISATVSGTLEAQPILGLMKVEII